MLEINQIHQGDCLQLMKQIDDASVDMILCDLPYGTTSRNEWDTPLPFEEMWKQYKRIIKENGIIVLFSDEPFTSELICSNLKMFKQRITWDKDKKFGYLNAHKMLMKQTEDICLFWNKLPTFNPQMVKAKTERGKYKQSDGSKSLNYGNVKEIKRDDDYDWTQSYPSNLIKISCNLKECNSLNRLHPTQKPVELLRWLIKTYTSEKDIILDNCCGSGSTLMASKHLNRRFIGIEINPDYIEVCKKRLKQKTIFEIAEKRLCQNTLSGVR